MELERATTATDLQSAALRMAAVLSHRGPDDEGAWVDAECGIAMSHRRLSILDLSMDGHQPMVSADGRHVIVFNGEIYNFRQLRSELERLGCGFRGHSDTEVMLAAVSRWGIGDALTRFNGMFAFAVWDRRERTLTLARDRLGEKPLYYGRVGQRFVFASELKAIRACSESLEVSRIALRQLLQYSYIPGPLCIYRGIWKLPPGATLTYRAEMTALPEPVPYWSARGAAEQGAAAPFRGSPEDAVDQLHALLSEAVKLRMQADVPLGAFLSGGIDSSTVVALMQFHSARPVKTFSIGFAEPGYDEAGHAAAVARRLGTDHTEAYVSHTEALSLLPRLASIYDEPFADSSQIPTYLVSELARQSVTVSLSGDGGDELFGGYTRYAIGRRIERRIGWIPIGARRALASGIRWAGGVPGMPKRRSSRLIDLLLADGQEGTYHALMAHWGDPESAVANGLDSAKARSGLEAAPLVDSFTRKMMYFDLVRYLPDDILVKLDRASMAVSLESRVPLLDHRVVEFSCALPMDILEREGQAKWPLRQVLYRHIERELVDRPKMGFGIPLAEWLRSGLREWAEALLSERRLTAEGFFDPRPVRQKWQEHITGACDWHYHLWDVLMFQAWHEEAAKTPSAPTTLSLVAGN